MPARPVVLGVLAAVLAVAVVVAGGLALRGGNDPFTTSSGRATPPAPPEATAGTAAPGTEPPTARADTTPAATATPPPPAAADAPPAAQPPSPPPTTAGALDAADLPPADALGGDWVPYVDPGSVEDGYAGNDSWVRAREPADLMAGLAAVGCPGAAAAGPPPEPQHALEGTYEGPAGARGVTVLLDYGDPATAERFLDRHRAAVGACPAPTGTPAATDPLTLVVEPVRESEDAVVAERREYGVGASPLAWTEAVVRTGDRVALLTVGVPPGADGPDGAALEEALRAALDAGS